MTRAAALALALIAAPAWAEEPMTGEAFRALTEGWTLHFQNADGEYYGTEQFLSDGRTVWLRAGGQCHDGVWVEDGDRICFLYEVGVSCWRLFPEGADGFSAQSADGGANDGARISAFRKDRSPLVCPDAPGV